VTASLISEVTDTVNEDVKAWQNRPLDELYPIVYLDALDVNIKVAGRVSKRAVYGVLGINRDGTKDVLGLWIGEAEAEGAKFWLDVLTDLKNRGLKDILIACCDGLKGFPQAIEAVYPQTQVQLCIVHLIRNCLRYVPWKDSKVVAADLKPIYQAATLRTPKRPWRPLPTSGMRPILPSAKSGCATGRTSFPSLTIPWTFDGSSTLPTRLNRSTAPCAR